MIYWHVKVSLIGGDIIKSINTYFKEFLENTVNLSQKDYENGRTSRNWLFNQISKFPEKNNAFPDLAQSYNLTFGSFGRKTKIQPLDDIDIMVRLNGFNGKYTTDYNYITIDTDKMPNTKLKAFDDGNNNISSIKILEIFKKELKQIPQYQTAEIKRNQESVTLQLKSGLNFDIVPCFYTSKENNGRQYYIIPDGNGTWKKTDPKIMQDKISETNQNNNGNVLNQVRLVKYWNKRQTMPSISSYLLETLVLNYYNTYSFVNIKNDFRSNLVYIHKMIGQPINDPNDIDGNINELDENTIFKIKNKAYNDYYTCCDAIELEENGEITEAKKLWKKIFGDEFDG